MVAPNGLDRSDHTAPDAGRTFAGAMARRRRRRLVGRDSPYPVAGRSLAYGAAEVTSVDGSGLPIPRRRTFAAPILGFAHSEETALRHPWLRWFPRPAPGAWATPTDDAVGVSEAPQPRAACIGCNATRPSTVRHAARRSLAPRAIRVAPLRRQSAPTGSPHRGGRTRSAARKAAGRAEARRARRGHAWPAER